MKEIEKLIKEYGEVFVLNLIYSGGIREYMNTRINADMKDAVDRVIKPALFKAALARKKEVKLSEIKISFTK